jgi:hypothetical protein
MCALLRCSRPCVWYLRRCSVASSFLVSDPSSHSHASESEPRTRAQRAPHASKASLARERQRVPHASEASYNVSAVQAASRPREGTIPPVARHSPNVDSFWPVGGRRAIREESCLANCRIVPTSNS